MSKESFDFRHVPVLYRECLDGLNIRPDGLYVDCTLGGGGHASGILSSLGADGRLIALDKDQEALSAASERLGEVDSAGSYVTVRSDFRELGRCLDELGIERVDGILADLGVSSHQLDTEARGFSYLSDGPLDMRMDRSQNYSAYNLVNEAGEEELERCFRIYGEERYAGRIARAIVRARQDRPLETCRELSALIAAAVPAAARRDKNPSRRCFQALRIRVNDELGALESLLDTAADVLNDRGRLCVISFHSLEDRLLKQRFREWENPCTCPPGLPCVCGRIPLGHVVSRKGIVAEQDEMAVNRRARSARLRIFERERASR